MTTKIKQTIIGITDVSCYRSSKGKELVLEEIHESWEASNHLPWFNFWELILWCEHVSMKRTAHFLGFSEISNLVSVATVIVYEEQLNVHT